MKLIRVNAKGFKSFAEEVRLDFDGGVVGIVGPNGSGKSNINDAIKWVLGEKSFKALRGDKVDDIIFSGSKTEKPQDKCWVTLTFDNSVNPISYPDKEITITREVNRGQSSNKYYINGAEAKYKDIKDIAQESGISKSSLAIIAQGTVSQIAEATPEQRRGIIEDAAGTSKYKSRKEESLRKLERTQIALDKVDTVVNELSKQLEPLAKQAEKAKKYLVKSEELKDIEVGLIVHDLKNLNSQIEQSQDNLTHFYDLKENLLEKITKTEEKIQEDLSYKIELDSELANINENLSQTNDKLLDLEKRFAVENSKRDLIISGQQTASSNEQIEALKQQLDLLSSQISNATNWIKTTQEKIQEEKKEISRYEMEIANLKLKEDTTSSKLSKVKAKIEFLKDEKENKTNVFKGTKTILNHSSSFAGFNGMVSDLLEIPSEYSSAVESILQNALQHIVVDDSQDAIKMIEFLKTNNGGRATFIPLSSIKSKNVRDEYILKIGKTHGFIDVASNLIKTKDKYNTLLKFLLGNVLLAEDIKSANKISEIVDRKYMVATLDGDLVRVGGIMTGGTKASSTLNIEQNIKELEGILPQLEDIVADYRKNILNLQNKNQEKNSLVSALVTEVASNTNKLEILNDKFSAFKVEYETKSNKTFNVEFVKNIGVELEELKLHKSTITATLTSKTEKLNNINYSISNNQQQKNEFEKELRTLESNLAIKINENSRSKIFLDNLNKRLSEYYKMTFENAKEEYSLSMPIEEARQTVSFLKTEIDELGNVNLDSIEQYEEVKKRYDHISQDQNELLEAKKIILNAIDEMDKIIISKINETMEMVDIEFNNVFREMFGGGESKVFLIDPLDPLESGVDIVAQPPGKSVKNLKLFSGGEKALIAISLLFAIIKAKPLPLCILDEVEAALDEANVVRYAEFLQKLKQDTQFIVITHRHGTMSRVDHLFGASMQKRGVTSFFTLKLSEAKKLIENDN